jgi:hypothetical protein
MAGETADVHGAAKGVCGDPASGQRFEAELGLVAFDARWHDPVGVSCTGPAR